MSSRNHALITGTGRTGTTFLVELLTYLGLETGFSAEDIASISKEARAGLEYDLRQNDCPYIVKDPAFCDYAEEVLSQDAIIIDHVFIPFRDLHAAAESRRYVAKSNISKMSLLKRIKQIIKPEKFAGGLWHTRSGLAGRQEEILLRQTYKLMLALSGRNIPVTLLRYPRLVKDCQYLYRKLKPVINDISYERFSQAFNNAVRKDLVHTFGENDK